MCGYIMLSKSSEKQDRPVAFMRYLWRLVSQITSGISRYSRSQLKNVMFYQEY